MPGGKVSPKLGGIGFVSRYPIYKIIWEMSRQRKSGVRLLNREMMKKHTGTLRGAFRSYQIKGNRPVTATSRKKIRDLIEARAEKVLNAPANEKWRKKLFQALRCEYRDKSDWKCTDDGKRISTRDKMFRVEISLLLSSAHRQGCSPTANLEDLNMALNNLLPFSRPEEESLKLLSDLSSQIRISSSRWRDPALVDLINAIGPVWKEVTGRTLKYISANASGSNQHNRFAIWLGDTFSNLNLPPPPPKRVLDIVKSLEI
jgi:hypothetical protein